jgi:hypothetical protein
MKRRDFFKTAGIGSASMLSLPALTGVLAEPAWARSELDGRPADTFSVLLSGPYKPVADCPDLGLTTVNVCDGTYSTTGIYPVSGLPVEDGKRANDPHRGSPIGRFYVQFSALIAPTTFRGARSRWCSRATVWCQFPTARAGRTL